MDTEKLVGCSRRPDPWASEHFQSDPERVKEPRIRNNLARRGCDHAVAEQLRRNHPKAFEQYSLDIEPR
jgi:hypothetical protein